MTGNDVANRSAAVKEFQYVPNPGPEVGGHRNRSLRGCSLWGRSRGRRGMFPLRGVQAGAPDGW